MPDALDLALIATVGLFAVFTGANDGGALVATTLKMVAVKPLLAVLGLTLAVVIAPLVFGTNVATTLARRLVSFGGANARLALLLVVVSAIVLVATLSAKGIPTSLTLALIGGMLGVGLGGDLPIAWGPVVLVSGLALCAPLAGMVGVTVIRRLWSALPLRFAVRQQVRFLQRIGFVLQALAYGTNDAQKMLAIGALAVSGAGVHDRVDANAGMLVVLGLLFTAGMVLAARRHGRRVSATIPRLAPAHAASAQLASAATVLASSASGVPVSMTQTLTGALLAGQPGRGVRQLRLNRVGTLALAWLVTLPAAMIVGLVPAAVLVRR